MTRAQLYLALSEALHAALPLDHGPDGAALTQWEADCGHIATALSAHHPEFDRARFLTDCGMSACTPRVSAELVGLMREHIRLCGRARTEALLADKVPSGAKICLLNVPEERRAALQSTLEDDIMRARALGWRPT